MVPLRRGIVQQFKMWGKQRPSNYFHVLPDDQLAAFPTSGMKSLKKVKVILIIIHHGITQRTCSARLFDPNPRSSTLGTRKLWTLTHSGINFRFFRDTSRESARILNIPFQDVGSLTAELALLDRMWWYLKIHRCWYTPLIFIYFWTKYNAPPTTIAIRTRTNESDDRRVRGAGLAWHSCQSCGPVNLFSQYL